MFQRRPTASVRLSLSLSVCIFTIMFVWPCFESNSRCRTLIGWEQTVRFKCRFGTPVVIAEWICSWPIELCMRDYAKIYCATLVVNVSGSFPVHCLVLKSPRPSQEDDQYTIFYGRVHIQELDADQYAILYWKVCIQDLTGDSTLSCTDESVSRAYLLTSTLYCTAVVKSRLLTSRYRIQAVAVTVLTSRSSHWRHHPEVLFQTSPSLFWCSIPAIIITITVSTSHSSCRHHDLNITFQSLFSPSCCDVPSVVIVAVLPSCSWRHHPDLAHHRHHHFHHRRPDVAGFWRYTSSLHSCLHYCHRPDGCADVAASSSSSRHFIVVPFAINSQQP